MWTVLAFSCLALVVAYAAITLYVYTSQRNLLFRPMHGMVMSPTDIGLEFEDIFIPTAHGSRIHGWWIPHKTPRFTVLFSHGNGGNISHRGETFRLFHQLGLSIFIYDYAGYGQSDGQPSEETTRADARAAWEWLVRVQGIRPETIILFGRSLGGAVTAELAGYLSREGIRPAGAVFESTFTSVPDMGAHMYPLLPVRLLARYEYDSVAALRGVRIPALFGHSETDDVVPYQLGVRLYESYEGPKSFFPLSGTHNAGYLFMEAAYPAGLETFLVSLELKQGNEAGQ